MRGIDRRGVLSNRRPAGLVCRDDEHLRGALERIGEGVRVGEVAAPHADAACGKAGGAVGVANTDADLVRRDPLEQLMDDLGAELAGRAGDDDHVPPSCYRWKEL